MKAKHTPRPWTFDVEGMVVVGTCGSSSDQRDICYVNPETGDEKDWFPSAETAVANGHLMTASPDMHALLVEAVDHAITNDWLRRARKCLKKAKGE